MKFTYSRATRFLFRLFGWYNVQVFFQAMSNVVLSGQGSFLFERATGDLPFHKPLFPVFGGFPFFAPKAYVG